MLLWLPNGSFFWKNVAVAQVLGGYPSSLFILGSLFWVLHTKPMVFYDFRGPEGPRGEFTRVRRHQKCNPWAPNLARSFNKSKDLGTRGPISQGKSKERWNREDGRLDFSLRLVAPGGPADFYRFE